MDDDRRHAARCRPAPACGRARFRRAPGSAARSARRDKPGAGSGPRARRRGPASRSACPRVGETPRRPRPRRGHRTGRPRSAVAAATSLPIGRVAPRPSRIPTAMASRSAVPLTKDMVLRSARIRGQHVARRLQQHEANRVGPGLERDCVRKVFLPAEADHARAAGRSASTGKSGDGTRASRRPVAQNRPASRRSWRRRRRHRRSCVQARHPPRIPSGARRSCRAPAPAQR